MEHQNELSESLPPRRRLRKRWIAWALLASWAGVGVWNVTKPMPPGTDVTTAPVRVPAGDVQFLYDLTRTQPQNPAEPVYEQRIFDEVFRIVDESRSFVVADFFLLNELMGASGAAHRPLSRELADHLIARKRAMPDLQVLLLTDPINDVYGGAPSPLLAELRKAGIEVVVTDLEHLRDSNALYSSLWRMLLQWWGNAPSGGGMSNPFTSDGSKITLRSWLALLNFKANHRKLIVADREDGTLAALVTSANPHDASSAHSNVALRFSGALAEDIVGSEMAIARFSGWRGHIYAAAAESAAPDEQQSVALSFITEEAIRSHLLDAVGGTRNGDSVEIATFYLADRNVVNALLGAANRGVRVRVILDPNRDAFGRQKDGVPNRPVANELVTRSGERIQVRWYRTHGEQFHTKIAMIRRGDRFVASLGSANLTRRNVGNYNLEANIAVETGAESPLAVEMLSYFDRLWNNDGPPGTEYTAAFGAYRDEDKKRYWRYRVMEATGLSTW
ncbi:MAG TPA: phospholipase D-like domain-containing protein [Steroidobacteraceae bacterium]|jgi:phosphatidylserine/phosphatidylglycerophosphate/cardiolipin synthase-like enzyme